MSNAKNANRPGGRGGNAPPHSSSRSHPNKAQPEVKAPPPVKEDNYVVGYDLIEPKRKRTRNRNKPATQEATSPSAPSTTPTPTSTSTPNATSTTTKGGKGKAQEEAAPVSTPEHTAAAGGGRAGREEQPLTQPHAQPAQPQLQPQGGEARQQNNRRGPLFAAEQNEIRDLQGKIQGVFVDIEELNHQIDVYKVERDAIRRVLKERRDVQNERKKKRQGLQHGRDEVRSRKASIDNSRRLKETMIHSAREKLPITKGKDSELVAINLAAIDREVRQLEEKMRINTLPGEDKKIDQQIRIAKAKKGPVLEFGKLIGVIQSPEEIKHAEELAAEEKVWTDQIVEMKEEDDRLHDEIGELLAQLEAMDKKIQPLADERRLKFGGVKELRDKKKTVTKDISAKKKEREEQIKRQREQQRKKQEEKNRKAAEEERKKLEAQQRKEQTRIPYEPEMRSCNKLIQHIKKNCLSRAQKQELFKQERELRKQQQAEKATAEKQITEKEESAEEQPEEKTEPTEESASPQESKQEDEKAIADEKKAEGETKSEDVEQEDEDLELSHPFNLLVEFELVSVAPPARRGDAMKTLESLMAKKRHLEQLSVARKAELRAKFPAMYVVREGQLPAAKRTRAPKASDGEQVAPKRENNNRAGKNAGASKQGQNENKEGQPAPRVRQQREKKSDSASASPIPATN